MNSPQLLIVLWWQVFIVTTESLTTANIGRMAKIECKHGLEAVEIITWKKDNVQIAFKSKSEDKFDDKKYKLDEVVGISYLIINKVLKEDAGNYTCIAFVVRPQKRYEEIEIKLDVNGSSSMVKWPLTTMLFAFLGYKICVAISIFP